MNALVPTDAGGAMRLAEMMATGKLVPGHLQRSAGDCLMVIEQAMRWGMSPFAVAQCTSVIQGKLMFEGKLVAAAVVSSGVLNGRLSYEFSGDGDARAIHVSGVLKGEAAPRDIVLKLSDAKTTNVFWAKQPDQQLVYAGTRVWARRHVPEVMLGVYSPEEMETQPPFAGATIDGTAEPARASTGSAETTDRRTQMNEDVPVNNGMGAAQKAQEAQAAADRLIATIQAVETEDALHDLAGNSDVNRGRDIIKRHNPEADEAIAAAMSKRFNDFLIPEGQAA